MKMNKGLNDNKLNIKYREDRNKWEATYYIKDFATGKNIRKRRMFLTEIDAINFMQSLEYQKENPVFIEKNGIPLIEILKLNVNRKRKMNIISDSQYKRVLMSIKKIEKSFIANKNNV